MMGDLHELILCQELFEVASTSHIRTCRPTFSKLLLIPKFFLTNYSITMQFISVTQYSLVALPKPVI
jgi:hypothetical protein